MKKLILKYNSKTGGGTLILERVPCWNVLSSFGRNLNRTAVRKVMKVQVEAPGICQQATGRQALSRCWKYPSGRPRPSRSKSWCSSFTRIRSSTLAEVPLHPRLARLSAVTLLQRIIDKRFLSFRMQATSRMFSWSWMCTNWPWVSSSLAWSSCACSTLRRPWTCRTFSVFAKMPTNYNWTNWKYERVMKLKLLLLSSSMPINYSLFL